MISTSNDNFRENKSKVTNGLLVFTILLNIILSLTILATYAVTSKKPFYGKVEKHEKYEDYKFWVQLYFIVPWILFTLYMGLAIVYFVVISRIINQFKEAYPDIFLEMRNKLFCFFFIYQTFIVYRAWNYAVVKFDVEFNPRFDR